MVRAAERHRAAQVDSESDFDSPFAAQSKNSDTGCNARWLSERLSRADRYAGITLSSSRCVSMAIFPEPGGPMSYGFAQRDSFSRGRDLCAAFDPRGMHDLRLLPYAGARVAVFLDME